MSPLQSQYPGLVVVVGDVGKVQVTLQRGTVLYCPGSEGLGAHPREAKGNVSASASPSTSRCLRVHQVWL